jgi:hypothetical protein
MIAMAIRSSMRMFSCWCISTRMASGCLELSSRPRRTTWVSTGSTGCNPENISSARRRRKPFVLTGVLLCGYRVQVARWARYYLLTRQTRPHAFWGTTDSSAAAPIDLRPGATYGGVDLTIAYVRAVHVRGRLTSSATGQPPRNGQVTLAPRPSGAGVSMNISQSMARVTSAGEFDFEGVPPGSYDIVSITNESGAPGVSGRFTARVPIEVGNADVNNISLILQPGLSVMGRLLIDG